MAIDRPLSDYAEVLDQLAKRVASTADEKGFRRSWDLLPQMLMLIVSECAEAMEAYRKLSDSQVRALDGIGAGFIVDEALVSEIEEELADVLIRALDALYVLGLRPGLSVVQKMRVNAGRPHLHGKHR